MDKTWISTPHNLIKQRLNRHIRVFLAVFACAFLLNCISPSIAWAEEGEAAKEGEHESGTEGEKAKELPKSKKELLEQGGANPFQNGFFIELKQMNVVSIYRNQAVRHMNIIVVLEMPDKEQYDYVMDRVEILRSAFVEELHIIGSAQKGQLLAHFDIVKDRLMKRASAAIGTGHIKDVLIKASAGRVLPGYYIDQRPKP